MRAARVLPVARELRGSVHGRQDVTPQGEERGEGEGAQRIGGKREETGEEVVWRDWFEVGKAGLEEWKEIRAEMKPVLSVPRDVPPLVDALDPECSGSSRLAFGDMSLREGRGEED